MTFRQMVIKSFLGNVRQYLAFFLCSTFSIMVFFMNVTLLFNKDITDGSSMDLMTYLLPITMVGITLFSIFFIIYANNSFIKARYKELGVYLTLGMDNREVRKLVNGQNLIIGGLSVCIGIIFGGLLSRIFQMAIIRILDLENVSFFLDYRSFGLTIITFVVVFAIVFLQNTRKLSKLDILGLLKEAKQMPEIIVNKKTKILGGLGVALMAFSLWMLLAILGNEKYNSNVALIFLYLGILFAGIYMTISKGGEMILAYRKRKNACRFPLLSIAETEQKYAQNKRILFVLSVLSSVTIVLVASPFSLLNLTESIAEMNINSVEYVETATANSLPEEKREEILNQETVTYEKKIELIYLYSDSQKQASVPVISVDVYNQQTGEQVQLDNGQCKNIILDWKPGYAGFDEGKTVDLYGANETYQYQVVAASHGPTCVNMSYPSAVMLLVNGHDYAELMEKEGETNWGIYHMVGYKDWKKTGELVNTLTTTFNNTTFPVVSYIGTYNDLKKGYSAFLFMTTVLGILFFVSGGSVLYFRQFTELAQTKENFYKLYKIGMTSQEMKKVISRELRVIFFVPLIFGAFGGVSIIIMLTHMFGGTDVLREFLVNVAKCLVVYFVFQGIFYMVTRNQYIKACNN